MTLSLATRPAATQHVRLIRSHAELAQIEDDWRNLQSRDENATVFSTWQWNETAARHFVSDGALRILLVEEDGAPVCLAPFALRRHLGLRTLSLITGGLRDYSLADYGDLLITPERAENAVTSVIEELAALEDWQQVWLQEVPGWSPVALLLPELARRRGWRVVIEPADATYAVKLPQTFEAYLATLSPNNRKALRRRANKLGRECGGEFHGVAPNEDPLSAFEALVALHERRWRSEGKPGIFADRTVHAFHVDIVRTLHADGLLDLTLLSANGEAVSGQYCLDFNGRRVFYTNGHNPEVAWQSLSLGFLTDINRVEDAIGRGFAIADFGRGEGEYKQRYAPTKNQNLHIHLFRDRGPALRYRAYAVARRTAKRARDELRRQFKRRHATRPAPTTRSEDPE